MKRKLLPVLLLSTLFYGSCASSYNSIRPETVFYNYTEISDDASISTGYAFDLMSARSNKKYAKKELKNGIKVVSVKVVNNTDAPININQDCRLFMGTREILPLDGAAAAFRLKQGVPIYLLYSLLTFNLIIDDMNGNRNSVSLPIGIPISAYNMIVAGSANKRMKDELIGNNILNKTVGPGETIYGIVCLNESTTGRLRFELNKR